MPSEQELFRALRELEIKNQELLEARESAILALKAKSEFLSNMSHELRTPLNAILGMGELLTETPLNSQQEQFVEILRRNGKSLLNLIDDILNFSRLENGQLPLNQSSFRIRDVVDRVGEMLGPMAAKKGLQLNCQVSQLAPTVVLGDAKKLEQILINLIGNAIKFTSTGHVELMVKPQLEVKDQILFSIRDTGIGIPAEKLSELFKRFSQTDTSITRSYGGTGLGLAISKQMVELMGGRIWIESEHNKGSNFYFTAILPPTKAHEGISLPLAPARPAPLQGIRILLAEDVRDNALLVSLFLRGTGCILDFAENGKVALEKFERTDYDVILMDIQMPEMDGYSATRWIRILEKQKNRNTAIVALTAFAQSEEKEKCMSAGCDAHLTKPLTKNSLLSAISSALEIRKPNVISAES